MATQQVCKSKYIFPGLGLRRAAGLLQRLFNLLGVVVVLRG